MRCGVVGMHAGVACGYIYGGVAGGTLGWRGAFFVEALMMVPFALFAFLAPAIHLRGGGGAPKESRGPSRPLSAHVRSFLEDVRQVVVTPVFAFTAAGYILYAAVIGVYSYFGPRVRAHFSIFFCCHL